MGLEFNGLNQYINIPNDASLCPSVITFCGWAKITDYTKDTIWFYKQTSSSFGPPYYQYAIWINNGSQGIDFQLAINGTYTEQYEAITQLQNGDTIFICATYDGTDMKIHFYKNGLYVNSYTYNAPGSLGCYDQDLQMSKHVGSYGSQQVWDKRIYNRALSLEESNTIFFSQGSDKNVEPHNDGLIGRWPMMEKSEGSIPQLLDSSGNNLNGTPIQGVMGYNSADNGLLLSNTIISVDDNNLLDITDALTVSLRLKFTEINESYILSKGGDRFALVLYPSYSGRIFCYTVAGAYEFTSVALNDDVWHLLTFTYDKDAGSNNFKIYVDGSLDAQATFTVTLNTDSLPLYFGAGQGGAYNWNGGTLKDIRVYNRAISLSEHQDLYNGDDISNTGLVGKWNASNPVEVGQILDKSGDRLYRKPILHSGLGSDVQVTSPKIGSSGILNGTPTYAPAKYGNGITTADRIGAGAKFVTTLGKQFAIEFWVKAVNNSSSFSDNDVFFQYCNTSNKFLHLEQIGNDVYPDIPTIFQGKYPFSFSNGDFFHYAIVCDSDNTSSRMRVFKDGTEITATAIYTSNAWTTIDLELSTYRQYDDAYGSSGDLVDNLKIYNYAKTDFSDRFEEFGYWQTKTQNNGTPINAPIYKNSPMKISVPKRKLI